jgi:hypothetical protein
MSDDLKTGKEYWDEAREQIETERHLPRPRDTDYSLADQNEYRFDALCCRIALETGQVHPPAKAERKFWDFFTSKPIDIEKDVEMEMER